jgi:hypothetical protein
MQHFACDENAAGACGKSGRGGNKLAERVEESILLEELEHGGGFAAGKDEPVKAFELLGFAHQYRARSGIGEGARVGVVVALQGEHADGEGIGFCGARGRRRAGFGCHRFPCFHDNGTMQR